MKAQPGEEVLFGQFRLLSQERLLKRAGNTVKIGGRSLDILICLANRAGELVSKKELMLRVWPNTVVDEGSLRVHVAALRKALGDGEAGARYISNVPGRGYCFVAPVSRRSSRAPPSNEPALSDQARRHLPQRLMRMVGRDKIVDALNAQLLTERFVTILGPGGIGKTTVAVCMCHRLIEAFDGAVHFVEFGTLGDPSLVPGTVASALGIHIASEKSVSGVVDFLRDKRMLLVMDCCEHVIETAAALAESIFQGAPQMYMIATSREPLRVEGEYVHRLDPLDSPPAGVSLTASEALRFPAVQAFAERVSANIARFTLSDADAPIAADICRMLDGMPLAIEIVAGRVEAHGMERIAALLNERLRLSWYGRRTALPRQRTLRATLDWSYDLLSEPERALLRRLGVFAGGFTLDAATAVMGGTEFTETIVTDCLASLVAKSFVSVDGNSTSHRLRLLETTRIYALERLVESGEAEQAFRCHASFFRDLFAPREPRSLMQPTIEAMPSFVVEIDNVRAALGWAFSPEGDEAIGIVLTAAYVPAWLHLALVAECRERAERALSALDAGSTLSDQLNIQMHIALGVAIYPMVGEFRMAQSAAERYVALARRSGNSSRILMADQLMGQTLHFTGRQREAKGYLEKVIDVQSKSGDEHVISFLYNQRVAARSILARTLCVLGLVDQAKHMARINFEEAQARDDKLSVCYTLARAGGRVALLAGDFAAAERAIAILSDLSADLGMPFWRQLADCLNGELLIRRGEVAKGSILLRAALDVMLMDRRALHHVGFLYPLAEGLGSAGRVSEGLATIEDALAHSERDGERWCEAELHRVKGELLALKESGRFSAAAEACLLRAIDVAREHGALFWELRATLSLARLWVEHGRRDGAHQLLAAVYNRFTEGFDTPDLCSAKAFLASL